MKKILSSLVLIAITAISPVLAQNNGGDYDIVIYGGSSSGVAAAIQSSRMGKKVVLIEPTQRIGGLTTGGLGATDIGNKAAIGGISREFYAGIFDYYENSSNWEWQNKSDYNQSRNSGGETTMWTFEPSAAMDVYEKMMAKEEIDLVLGERLDRENGVEKDGSKIVGIVMESGKTFSGKIFMDTTYEGDLMAAAGISYAVGRESSSEFDESLNGVQLYHKGVSEIKEPGKKNYFSRIPMNMHQFPDGVDPYKEPGNPQSGLLWGISSEPLAENGSGDDQVQAYNFRMTLTNNPKNRIPITKPEDYDPERYELLVRLFDAQPDLREINNYFIWTPMPNAKTDVNNRGAFSTDMIGMNHDWPEADYDEREEIFRDHINYTKGLLYFYISDPRVPKELSEFVSSWGYPKDEFLDSENFSPQLYIREGRRMIGEYIMDQNNVVSKRSVSDPIGLAAYGMDSHHIQRVVVDGMVKNEGDIQVHGFKPYPISYRSITPKKNEGTNLLVPLALSSSHIAFGSIRMEPVFMVLGQSAAIAATIAIDQDANVQDISYSELKQLLLENNQRLEWEPAN